MYRTFAKCLIWLTGLLENRGRKCHVDTELDVSYKQDTADEDVYGDFYIPKQRDVEHFPVALLVHGGGWAENDNRYQMIRIVDQFIRSGFAAFNVAYRLAPQHHFPAPVDDLLEAVTWLKDNEERLHIDLENLVFFGYSAGGHLAELAAMRPMPDGVRLRAVAAGGTPHFMRLDPDFPLVQQFMGHPWQEDPNRYRAATPVDSVTQDFPPVFIYHGAKDKLVPQQHVLKWQQRLKQLGVGHEVFWVKGRGHISTFLMPREAIEKAIHFLQTHCKSNTLSS